jgi:hypothetical protein
MQSKMEKNSKRRAEYREDTIYNTIITHCRHKLLAKNFHQIFKGGAIDVWNRAAKSFGIDETRVIL